LKFLKHIVFIALFLCSLNTAKAQTSYNFEKDSVSNLVLPNVFTPNFDSINDVFKPVTDEITELSFSIFNRWGNLIFETERVNGFWDGRTTSGEPCQDGVYFCVLTAKGIDNKDYKLKGFVQLYTGGFYKK